MSTYYCARRRLMSIKYSSAGFTFLELVVVVCLIAILFAFSAMQYQKRISDSRNEVLFYQSQAFKRSVDNIRAISSLQRSNIVNLGTGVYVYLHSSGWPYAANLSGKLLEPALSSSSCRSLWVNLFTGANLKNDNSSTKIKDDFEILLIDNYICRYKQFGEQEDSYFFDYDVRTGAVVTFGKEV